MNDIYSALPSDANANAEKGNTPLNPSPFTINRFTNPFDEDDNIVRETIREHNASDLVR
jgi:hypothetical protein